MCANYRHRLWKPTERTLRESCASQATRCYHQSALPTQSQQLICASWMDQFGDRVARRSLCWCDNEVTHFAFRLVEDKQVKQGALSWERTFGRVLREACVAKEPPDEGRPITVPSTRLCITPGMNN